MGGYLLNDLHLEEVYLDSLEQRRQQMAVLGSQVNRFTADHLLDIARTYPNLPNSVVIASTVAGVPAEHPALMSLATRQAETDLRAENTLTASQVPSWSGALGGIKGAVRGLFLGADAVMDEVILRPFRTLVVFGQQGFSPYELADIEQRYGYTPGLLTEKTQWQLVTDPEAVRAIKRAQQDGYQFTQWSAGMGGEEGGPLVGSMWQQMNAAWGLAGKSTGVRAIEELLADRPVDVGSGFFPKSTDPRTRPEYIEARNRGFSEEQAFNMVVNQYGRPITLERDYEQARGQYRGQPISPGRFLAVQVTEPGTPQYQLMSGLIDAYIRIKADPFYLALRASGPLRANNPYKHFADPSPWRGPFRTTGPGLINAPRRTVSGMTVDEIIRNPNARPLWEQLAANVGDEGWLRNYRMLEAYADKNLPTQLVDAVTGSTDPDAIANMMRLHMGLGETFQRVPFPTSALSHRATQRIVQGVARPLDPALSRPLFARFGDLLARIPADPSLQQLTRDAALSGGFKAAVRTRFGGGELGALFTEMPRRRLDMFNIPGSTVQFNRWLRVINLPEELRAPLVRAFAHIEPGDLKAGYGVVTRAARTVERYMVDTLGVDREVAKFVTKVFNQEVRGLEDLRVGLQDAIGNPAFNPLASIRNVGTGSTVEMITSPHLLAEHLASGITLPDPTLFFRATRHLSKVSAEAPDFARTLTQGSTLTHAMDIYMRKYWRPMTLLRVAWPIRVVGEEQVRMAASGLDSMFNHPFRWISWAIGRTGKSGVFGAERLLDEAVDFQQGMTRGVGAILGQPEAQAIKGGKAASWINSSPAYVKYAKPAMLADDAEQVAWFTSHADDYIRAHHDLLTRIIAEKGPVEAWDWFKNAPGGKALRQDLARGGEFGARQWILDPANPRTRLYFDSVDARLHQLTGGSYEFRVGPGWVDEGGGVYRWTGEGPIPGDVTGSYQITRQGHPDLIDGINRGRLGEGDELINFSHQAQLVPGGGYRRVPRSARMASSREVGDHLRRYYPDATPDFTKKAVNVFAEGKSPSWWDQQVDRMFTLLMGRTTDYLSRAPAFRQYYWEEAQKLIPAATEETRTAIIRAAGEANLPRSSLRQMARAVSESPNGTALRNLEEIDNLAKASALNRTRDLLYDLSKRHRITELTRNIAPFGEAWWEILSTWSRLIGRNPGLVRRLQIGVEGARNSGFFDLDPETGRETFNYPLVGQLWSLIGGFNDTPISVDLKGDVRGVNLFAGQVIPGLGPGLQIPLSAFGPLRDNPDLAWLRDLLLPFGPVEGVDDVGDIFTNPGAWTTDQFPAWLRRIRMLWVSGDPNLERLRDNGIIDIMQALILSGRYPRPDPQADPEGFANWQNVILDEATKIARWYIFLQAGGQLSAPSSPTPVFNVHVDGDPDLTKEGLYDETRYNQFSFMAEVLGDTPPPIHPEDTGGRVFTLTALTRDYYDKLEQNNGDTYKTSMWFFSNYGFDPASLSIPHSRTIHTRATGETGWEWQLRNRDLFDAFPDSAYYAGPVLDEGPFVYEAYLDGFRTGAREATTPQEWIKLYNWRSATLIYQHHRNTMYEQYGETDEVNAYLRALRLDLASKYDGYGEHGEQDIPGLPSRRAAHEIIQNELVNWAAEPRLSQTATGQGLDLYLRLRSRASELYQQLPGDRAEYGWLTADSGKQYRDWIRGEVPKIIAAYPDFAVLWHYVLEKEMTSDA